MDPQPAVQQHRRDRRAPGANVQTAHLVREVVGDHPPKDAAHIQQDDRVRGEPHARQAMQLVEQLDVEEGRIEAQEHEEARDDEQHKRRVAQRIVVDERAFATGRRQPRLHERHGNRAEREQEEGNHPRRPAEAHHGQEVAEDEGEHDPGQRAARAREADGERAAGAKVLRQDGRGRQEGQAHPYADAHALREEDVPVRRPQRGHELAEHDEEEAREEEVAEIPGVVEGAGDHADEHHEAGLQGADPGDV